MKSIRKEQIRRNARQLRTRCETLWFMVRKADPDVVGAWYWKVAFVGLFEFEHPSLAGVFVLTGHTAHEAYRGREWFAITYAQAKFRALKNLIKRLRRRIGK